MLTNKQRISLINRLQVLNREIQDITEVLAQNPCPVTDEDIDRGVSSLLDRQAILVLSSLDRQMKDGIDATVLATYYPDAKPGEKLRPYAQETNREALMVFQRLIDINQYTIVKGDEKASAYCLQLQFPDTKAQPSRLVSVSEEPDQPLVQVGPRQKVRQKVSDETLDLHLEYTNVTRSDLERAVKEVQGTLKDNEVIWFHVDVTNQKAADAAAEETTG